MKQKIILMSVCFLLFPSITFSQSSKSTKVFSSPSNTVAASAQSGANALVVSNTSAFGFATNLSIGWLSVAVGLVAASVWNGEDSVGYSPSTSTN